MSAQPRAYSYVRFSSPEQAQGDSLRRQTSLSLEYAARHGLYLDEMLQIRDLGVSAFRGKNNTDGALGAFIKEVDAGRIKRGSYLLVESLDRISRQDVDIALELFMSLIGKGITIVTLMDNSVYNTESIRKDPLSLMKSIIQMTLAHEESDKKSQRIRAAMVRRRSQLDKKKLTAMCPTWLELDKQTNKFVVIKERAELVRWIFERASCGIGKYVITREINEKQIAPWTREWTKQRKPRKWHESFISRILNSEAVLGRFTPCTYINGKRVPAGDPVPNYYPAIVPAALFEKVRSHAVKNRVGGGRIGTLVRNLFAHIMFCEQTGIPAIYVNKNPYYYLRPDDINWRRYKSWRYEEFEEFFLLAVGGLDLARIFEENTLSINETEMHLGEARVKFRDLETRVDRLMSALEEGTSQNVISRIRSLEDEQNALNTEIRKLEAQLSQEKDLYESASRTGKQLKDLIGQTDPSKRLLLRQEIRRIVSRIDIKFEVVPTEAELKEREEFLKMLDQARAKGMKMITAPSSVRGITITFSNGVKRTVDEGKGGVPVFTFETEDDSKSNVQSGRILSNPTTTPPKKRPKLLLPLQKPSSKLP